MLTDVERVEMKSKLAHFSQQGSDVGVSESLAAVGEQAVPYQQKILFKLRSRRVCGRSIDGVPTSLQTVKHIREKAAIALRLVAGAPCEVYALDRAFIMLEARQKIG